MKIINNQVWIKSLDKNSIQPYIRATDIARNNSIRRAKAEKPKFYDLKFLKIYLKFNWNLFFSKAYIFDQREYKWVIQITLMIIGLIIAYLF